MKIIGLMLAKNEDWIIGLSARAALEWCDELVILNHASTDSTADIISDIAKECPGRVYRIYIGEGDYWEEMDSRQITLETGRQLGGTHFAIIDADEVLTGNQLELIYAQVMSLAPGAHLMLPMVSPWGSLREYRSDDCVWTRAKLDVVFRDSPGLSWKAAPDGYDHHHRLPYGIGQAVDIPTPGVMHLQFANRRRLVAKHVWYRMVETLRWPGRMKAKQLNKKYDQALNEEGLKKALCPVEWWEPYDGLMSNVILDGVPWQEQAVKEMLWKHGAMSFRGLDLLGLDSN